MKKIIVSILLIISLGFCIFVPISKADDYTFNVKLTSDKAIVSSGDTFKITLEIDSLRTIGEGIRLLDTALIYDHDVFEPQVSKNANYNMNITGLEDWTFSFNKEQKTGKNILAQKAEYVNGKTKVLSIIFKANENLQEGKEYEFKLTDTGAVVKTDKTNDPYQDIKAADFSFKIKAKSDVLTENSKYIIETKDNITYIKGIMPDTKLTIFKENIKNSNNLKVKDENNVEVGETQIIQTGMTTSIEDKTYYLAVRGDLNGDGLINLVDVSFMKQHMVNLRQLTSSYKEAADINLNGEAADISDFSKLLDVYLKLDVLD